MHEKYEHFDFMRYYAIIYKIISISEIVIYVWGWTFVEVCNSLHVLMVLVTSI